MGFTTTLSRRVLLLVALASCTAVDVVDMKYFRA